MEDLCAFNFVLIHLPLAPFFIPVCKYSMFFLIPQVFFYVLEVRLASR